MLVLFGVLIIIASVILGFIVLVQNPKGGGLTGSLGGFSNQIIGVKQSTDIMEKGTWLFAAIVGVLCLISPAFIPKEGATKSDDILNKMPTSAPVAPKAAAPVNTTTMPGTQQTAPATGTDTAK